MELHVSDVAIAFHPPSKYPFDGPVNTNSRFVIQARRNNCGLSDCAVLFDQSDVRVGKVIVGDSPA